MEKEVIIWKMAKKSIWESLEGNEGIGEMMQLYYDLKI